MTGSSVHPNPPDRRRHAWRPDLAAAELKDIVAAPRFAEGEPAHVASPSVALRRTPAHDASFETEALFGEPVTIFDEVDGWAWVQLGRDRYVGYVPANALVHGPLPATHRVDALATLVYPKPDIKAPPLMNLSLGALLAVTSTDARFAGLATGGFIIARHIAQADRFEPDFVAVAERFVGTPYLWGGKTRLGLDCSGLVQTAMQAAGLMCPRDSDMQEAELGAPVAVSDDLHGLQRGDLVFWPGHVGIMLDGSAILHANAFHMTAAVEPLRLAADRIASVENGGTRIRTIKRLGALSATS